MFKKEREKLFAKMWQRMAPKADERLRELKENLFKRVHGVVLELGPGTGMNFQYFPTEITWIGVEPNQELQKVLSAHPERPKSFKLISRIEELPSESVDTVVSSLVLCSVPKPTETLKEIKRVLRQGGQYLCVEHVAAPRDTLLRFIQRIIRPVTRCLGGGCEPDREIGTLIYQTGFSKTDLAEYRLQIYRTPIKVPIISCAAQK